MPRSRRDVSAPGEEFPAAAATGRRPRRRLERRLDRLGPGGVGLLVASAGAGKSVLVSQWAVARPELRIAVLALGPTDDDGVVMARDLVEAIRVVAPEIEPKIGDVVMTGGVALGQPFVDALLAELALLSEPLVLVLEDVHVLTNRALLDDLGEFASRLPETIRCILTTRRDPPWPVRHLRLDGRLIEVRGTDLALDADEARQLVLAVSGRDLTDREVASLLDRTDGWAAGLQLAAISLRDSPDTGAAIQLFTGSDRLIAEYLLEEVLDRQSPELRRFLLQTSVLDWLSVEVCDAVTGVTALERCSMSSSSARSSSSRWTGPASGPGTSTCSETCCAISSGSRTRPPRENYTSGPPAASQSKAGSKSRSSICSPRGSTGGHSLRSRSTGTGSSSAVSPPRSYGG